MKKQLILFLLLIIGIPPVFGDELFTSLSSANPKIIYDGIWSFKTEWKETTLETVTLDSKDYLIIRVGHDYENLFLLLDVIGDTSINLLNDKAVVCFDTLIDKSNKPSPDDYCFQVLLDGKLITLKGDSTNYENNYLKIQNHENVKGIGGISGEFDRYSKIPHVSYEFQIPTDLIGRSSEYGFYVEIFDAQTNQTISWPQNIQNANSSFIPTPDKWGNLISPDKSLPEFSFSIIIYTIFPIMLGFMIITKMKFFKLYIK